MQSMTKKKPAQQPEGEQPKPGKKYPSRDRVRYLLVPKEMHEEIKRIAEEEERDISVIARRAVKEFLERMGRWPPKMDQKE